MTPTSKLFSDEFRCDTRRRVMSWARATHITEFASGLLEGPGGSGPDLLFFYNGAAMAIYIGEASSTKLPDENNDWCARWESLGCPPVSVFIAATEAGACKLLLNKLDVYWLQERGEGRH